MTPALPHKVNEQTPFGALLVKLMREHHVSTRRLATELGVSHAFIQMVTSGKRRTLAESHWRDLIRVFPGLTEVDLIRASRRSARQTTTIPLWRLRAEMRVAHAVEVLIEAVEDGRAPPEELVSAILLWAGS